MTRQYIDLTGPLSPDMWSYRPGIPDISPFEHRRWATIEERGWEADWFAMPTLAGTYLETAKHHMADAPSIDQIPPERFFVNAVIARVPKEAKEHITASDLKAASVPIRRGDALLVATGWDRHWSAEQTFAPQSPHFDLEAMQWIVDQGVSILGGDMPCFDDPDAAGAQGVNLVLLGSGALILAPLVNLGQIQAMSGTLTVLPIPLVGSCGAPCRAIFIEDA
jgi:kynurenine formamidase